MSGLVGYRSFCFFFSRYVYIFQAEFLYRCASGSTDQCSTASLNSINLGEVNGRSAESYGKFVAVEVFAFGRGHRTKGVAGHGAQSTITRSRATQRTMLLSLLPIRRERCRKRLLRRGEIGREFVRGRSRVGLRSVVDGSGHSSSKFYEGNSLSMCSRGSQYFGRQHLCR